MKCTSPNDINLVGGWTGCGFRTHTHTHTLAGEGRRIEYWRTGRRTIHFFFFPLLSWVGSLPPGNTSLGKLISLTSSVRGLIMDGDNGEEMSENSEYGVETQARRREIHKMAERGREKEIKGRGTAEGLN